MRQAKRLSRNPSLLTLLLSAAALAGYASYRLIAGSTGDAEPAMTSEHDHAALPPVLADALPAIVINDLAGKPTPLTSFAGRPLLVNFWATWCAPCLREIPLLKAFHEEQPNIDVIGIAVDRPEPVFEYADQMQFNYPVLVGLGEGMDAMAEFRNDAGAMPFSVLVAAGGQVLASHAGELHAEHLAQFAATVDALERGAIDLAGARERLAAP